MAKHYMVLKDSTVTDRASDLGNNASPSSVWSLFYLQRYLRSVYLVPLQIRSKYRGKLSITDLRDKQNGVVGFTSSLDLISVIQL